MKEVNNSTAKLPANQKLNSTIQSAFDSVNALFITQESNNNCNENPVSDLEKEERSALKSEIQILINEILSHPLVPAVFKNIIKGAGK